MAFSLGSLTQKLTGALTGKAEGSVIGVDIGSSSAKIVQLRGAHGAAILETYGEIALGPYAKEAVGKAVKLTPEKTTEVLLDLMREANVTARAAGMSIPFSSSLVSILDLPKSDPEQLKRMIPIEARKYIPMQVSEVMLDWFVIPPDDEDVHRRARRRAHDASRHHGRAADDGAARALLRLGFRESRAHEARARACGERRGFYRRERSHQGIAHIHTGESVRRGG